MYMHRNFNDDTNNVGWIKDEGRIHQILTEFTPLDKGMPGSCLPR